MLVLCFTACNVFNRHRNSNKINVDPTLRSTKGDFSTPRAGAETFLKAAVERDVEILSQCFDACVEREFRPFQSKSASFEELDSLSDQMKGATVGEVVESGDTAKVKIMMKQTDTITMRRTAGEWKIKNF
jgi:hypothetical protein